MRGRQTLFAASGNSFLRLLVGLIVAIAVTPSWGQDIGFGSITVNLTEVDVGLAGPDQFAPTDMMPLNDGTGRQVVTTYVGTVRMLSGAGSLLETPLLTATQTATDPQFEDGLVAIAVHPEFATPGSFGFGKVYTLATENNGSGVPDFGSGNAHQDVIREWDMSAIVGDEDVNVFNGTTSDSREILRVQQPSGIHNVFDIAFDGSGLLYITSGDSGSNASNSQNLGTIYGNVLRIDPNNTPSGNGTLGANSEYRIPGDNPFVSDPTALDEIWAYGLRSPYRANFDSATDDLYLADVGAGSREEINLIEAGNNYGWPAKEGTLGPDDPQYTDPMFEYGRSDGETVIGGFVYRGSAIPALEGAYVFADFGRQVTGGQAPTPARLFYGIVDPNDPDFGEVFEFRIDAIGEQLVGSDNRSIQFIFAITEGSDGELFLLVGDDPSFGGAVDPDGRILSINVSSTSGVPGDVNGDGFVNGDGNGLPDEDDVSAFILGWGTTGHPTIEEQIMNGDLNLDGMTDFADWQILRVNHENSGNIDLVALLAVPEPTSLVSLVACALVLGGATRYRRLRSPA